jgi:hypothetical protein
MTDCKFKITWSRHTHWPRDIEMSCLQGADVDLSQERRPACVVRLPYPAPPQLGLFRIKCQSCGSYVVVPSCGRPDDPRSVKLACRRRGISDGLEADEAHP